MIPGKRQGSVGQHRAQPAPSMAGCAPPGRIGNPDCDSGTSKVPASQALPKFKKKSECEVMHGGNVHILSSYFPHQLIYIAPTSKK